ncbi:MAG: RNase P subunit p30 family protein [Candidatus Woesearchaeota archaeon]
MIDIVIPHNNEEEFISMAEKLGYDGVCLLYHSFNVSKKFDSKNIKIYSEVLADSKLFNKKKPNGFVAVKSSNNDKEIMERSKSDMIFSFEDNARKDFIHQRGSGLNHIMCRLAKKNNVIIGFSLNSILNEGNIQRIMGRMKQNIKLCRKFKVRSLIASFAENPFDMRSSHDMISLFKILGMENPEFLKESDIRGM